MRLARDLGIALAGGLVVALLQIIVPGASLGRFLAVALAGTLIGVLVISFIENRRSNAAPPSRQIPVKPERVFVPASVTPTNLVKQREGLTSLQAEKLFAFYVGKWMKVSGTVYEVKKGYPGIYVFIHGADQGPIMALDFDKNWTARVSMIGKGHTIQAVGQVESVDDSSVSLDHCELVNGTEG